MNLAAARELRPDVSVLIVTWNADETISRCLESIERHTRANSYEVIVVDNGSCDKTRTILSNEFPYVRVVRTETNLGFAPAMNIALNAARGRNLFLLNPDTEFVNDVVGRLVAFLDLHPEAGSVSPQLLDPDGSVNMFVTRQFPSVLNTFLRHFGLRKLFSTHRWFGQEYLPIWHRNSAASVPCLTGAAIVIPRKVFSEVGYLDTAIPMYFEDLDYCKRIADTNRALYYVPAAQVIHVGAASASASPARALLLSMQNGEAPWLFIRRYSGHLPAAVFRAIVAAGSLVRLTVLCVLRTFARRLQGGVMRDSEVETAAALALLKWAFTRRSRFYRQVNCYFTRVGIVS